VISGGTTPITAGMIEQRVDAALVRANDLVVYETRSSTPVRLQDQSGRSAVWLDLATGSQKRVRFALDGRPEEASLLPGFSTRGTLHGGCPVRRRFS
jgi:hypothetical protein